jgi:malic enzyme
MSPFPSLMSGVVFTAGAVFFLQNTMRLVQFNLRQSICECCHNCRQAVALPKLWGLQCNLCMLFPFIFARACVCVCAQAHALPKLWGLQCNLCMLFPFIFARACVCVCVCVCVRKHMRFPNCGACIATCACSFLSSLTEHVCVC